MTCDESKTKLVALFDGEATEEDEALVSAHVSTCSECQIFREAMIEIGQEFAAVAVPLLPAAIGRELIGEVTADRVRTKPSGPGGSGGSRPRRANLRRLACVGGLIGFLFLALSGLLCLTLAREVAVLRSDLEVAKRDAALVRMEKQVEEAEERRQKERKEQKAISARHFRTAELMRQSDRSYSPRTSLFRREGDNI